MQTSSSSTRTSDTSDLFLFVPDRDKLYFVEYNEDENRREDRPIIRISKRTIVNYFKGFWNELLVLGSCSGLVCLTSTDRYCLLIRCGRLNIHIVNPITEEHFQLPNSVIPESCGTITKRLYGFGFDVCKKEYKVVILLFYVPRKSKTIMSEMEMFSVGCNAWRRTTGIVPTILRNTSEESSHVFLNGSLHWVSVNSKSSGVAPLIVSLDLGREEFGVIQTPKSVVVNLDKYIHGCYPLGMLQKCLSLVDSSLDFIDIWVMKNDNGMKNWIKLFSIQRRLGPFLAYHSPLVPIKYQKNSEILLRYKDKLVTYNADSNTSFSV
ncbi:hypothetical protein IFM89_010128 [Coptis chinensis]|uniref:F-box associated beta-propeller type 3 domain-containing protein n=1 Tax=Coptis chinensis TaxID=261450 RepID=A0A835IA59_9MAGN|nr:hypothetical protein IFM89_010128 [Coptis chinensis]